MKRNSFNPEKNREETALTKDTLEKNDVSDKIEMFFRKFSEKYLKPDKNASEDLQEKNWVEEVRQLDENTAPEPLIRNETENSDISPEELYQLEENDPGYVNGLVLDYENEKNDSRNIYRETGRHTGAIHWGKYAVDHSEKYVMLEPGSVLVRWGGESGSFMAFPNTPFDKLELPVVEEKLTKQMYEVCKPFPAENSRIKKQPWNKGAVSEEQTEQIKLPVSVKKLLEEGYLRLKKESND